jgi:hypothetical protein
VSQRVFYCYGTHGFDTVTSVTGDGLLTVWFSVILYDRIEQYSPILACISQFNGFSLLVKKTIQFVFTYFLQYATDNIRARGAIFCCPLWFLFSDETLYCPVKETNLLGSGELRVVKLDISSSLKRGK